MKVNKNKILLTVLVSLLLMSGCAASTEITTKAPRPTLESSHVLKKNVEYCVNDKCYTLKKNGIYINEQDASELLHYIDKLK